MIDLVPLGTTSLGSAFVEGVDLSLERLDWVVACIDWRLCFPKGYVEHLCCIYFDYNLILLHCGCRELTQGEIPFSV